MTEPDDLPERVARLEHEVAHIRQDAAAARFLAGSSDRDVSDFMVKLNSQTTMLSSLRDVQFKHHRDFSARFDKVESDVAQVSDRVETGFADMNDKFAGVDDQLAAVNGRFASVDNQFAAVNDKFAGVDARFDQMDDKLARITDLLTSRKSEPDQR